MGRLLRRMTLATIALAVLVGVSILAGAVPISAGARAEGEAAHRIYVLSNGFHSDIAVPADLGFERLSLSPSDYPVVPSDIRYLAIGWGSRTAYTSLRKVSDLSLGIIARSYAFDDTVVHVQPLGDMQPSDRVFAYDLTPAQMDLLMSRIAESFATAEPIRDLTQGFGDRFYNGRGRFTPVHSCNTWVGRNLRAIGIGVGLWPVTAQTLEFGLRRTALNRQLDP